MEKPQINFSVPRIVSFLKTLAGRTANADTLWRIILGSVFCLIVGVCIFAYFTYLWAINTELPQVVTKKDHDAFSLTDIKKVIARYHAKEEAYNNLLHSRPVAPQYMKGKGVVVFSPSDLPQVNLTASGTPPHLPVADTSLQPG